MSMKLNKYLIIIIMALVLVFLTVIVIENSKEQQEGISIESQILYNNETEEYEIYNEKNELIKVTTDKAEIEFYQNHSDYNPTQMVDSNTLKEWSNIK